MNAPLFSEKLLRLADSGQAPLALATPGVQRYVWESRFGEILIEVIGERSFVNGRPVEPLSTTDPGSANATEPVAPPSGLLRG